MKNIVLILFLVFFKMGFTQSGGKKDTKLSDKESQKIFQELDGSLKEESLSRASKDACTCIDSITSYDKTAEALSAEIKKCIDKEVSSYKMAQTLFDLLKGIEDTPGDKIISISDDKDSKEYMEYYYAIEKRLMDSCVSLKKAISSRDKVSKNSYSENDEAMKQYTFGAQLSDKEMYQEAIPFYEKAVKIDPLFVFAWDNLGICYRKTNETDKAINAYKKSLSINPYGEMPLQNIAVAYEMNQEPDKAITAYKEYLDSYPNGVEGYFGIGRQLMFYKKDYEGALDNMCKAYNLYVKMNSPYRVDAEKMINVLYKKMKEKKFNEILKENKIVINK